MRRTEAMGEFMRLGERQGAAARPQPEGEGLVE
jgi:hypothetical protein